MDVIKEARTVIEEWRRGQTSNQYETGGQGADSISSGVDDRGGVSYGSYQFATNTGGVQEYLAQSKYGPQFDGLQPATQEFNARWKQLAKGDPGFATDQHDFIQRKYYDVQQAILQDRGIDLGGRGKAVQDALWSTSVQYRDLTPGIFENGLQEKFGKDFKLSELSDEQVVGAVQDYKLAHVQTHFKSSSKLWDSLSARVESEKASLVTLARFEEIVRNPTPYTGKSYQEIYGEDPVKAGERVARNPMADGMLKQGEHGEPIKAMQEQLVALGYVGTDGKPLKPDGDFGNSTQHALEQFQHDHGLAVDDKAGAKTLVALDAATRARRSVATLADPLHSDHARYAQSVDRLEALEALRRQAGLPVLFGDQQQLQRAAGQVAFESKVAGLAQIDSIVARLDGQGVFAVQGTVGDPAARRAYVDRVQALGQSVEASTQQLDDFNRQFVQPAQSEAPVQTPGLSR
ncbi:MAG: peptidoglycan-binding domain-containing protein [Pseudoxanthomonas sp.]